MKTQESKDNKFFNEETIKGRILIPPPIYYGDMLFGFLHSASFQKKKREKEKKRERETVGEEINLPQSLVIYQTTSLGF